jgi:hypothetical protein
VIVCDPDLYDVCLCLGEDDEDPYSCVCAPASGVELRCEACGSKMVVIDADTGQRLAS